MNWTFALAIWGAFLSTTLAVLKVLEFRRDRGNIKITVKGSYKILPTTKAYGNRPLVVITAVNKGRRPVTLKGAALLLPRKEGHLICIDSMTAGRSVELTEGRSHDYLMFEDDVKNQYGLTPAKYVACVWDATGRYHWSHGILKRFLKLHRMK
ncbi:MAG: hypothetical protein KAW02_05290 [candidate division Zixibacteria bacterium]|nr:hypothetical protein [candidate division Zixibacteria bacterium]